MTTTERFFDRYRPTAKLGEGTFGKIYKGVDVVTNAQVAIKVETNEPGSKDQLKWERQVYKDLQNASVSKTRRWPQIHMYGTEKGHTVMVMDILGPNMDHVLRKSNGKLPPSTVAYLAVKMINLLETFHKHGYVHRDLKPQNFVMELSSNGLTVPRYPEVFLIDFGLAKCYVESDKCTHAPFAQEKSLKGTVRYSSINTHLGIDQSRRDDLQSLGYILLYFLVGHLPWKNSLKKKENGAGAVADNREERRAGYFRVMLKKMSVPIDVLTESLPEPIKIAMTSFLFYVHSLMYHENPNYEYMRSLFYPLKKRYNGALSESWP